MFNHISFFLSLLTLPRPVSVKLGDRKIVMSTQGGSVLIGSLIIYANYVPTIKFSLLSVSCLDTSGSCTVFVNKTCTITSRDDHCIILTAQLQNGLYLRKVNLCPNTSNRITPTLNESPTSATATATPNKPPTQAADRPCDLWRRRLGHMNYDYISIHLPGKTKQLSHPSCKACILSE